MTSPSDRANQSERHSRGWYDDMDGQAISSRLVALDLHTGQRLWQTEPRPTEQRAINEGTWVMAEDTVIFAAPPVLEVRCLNDGCLLWRRRTNTSFRGMPDVFVIYKLV